MSLDRNKQKVLEVITERNLTEIMNDTKWQELQSAVLNDLLFPPPYQVKYVLEESLIPEEFESDVWYWGDWIEGLMPFYNVEWIRVRARYHKNRGRLVAPEVIDITEEFMKLLTDYSIPYRKDDESIYIYGYSASPSTLTIGR